MRKTTQILISPGSKTRGGGGGLWPQEGLNAIYVQRNKGLPWTSTAYRSDFCLWDYNKSTI